MKPTFGDKKTIERLDPRRAILMDGIAVPREIEVCRFCGADLWAEFDDTWTGENEWGAGTVRLECMAEPEDIGSTVWGDWTLGHEYDNQSDCMDDEAKVIRWLSSVHPNFRNEC